MNTWDKHSDHDLVDILFDSNLSIREIAAEFNRSESDVNKRIRELGVDWVRRNKGNASRGQAALTAIMRKLLPGEKIVTEHPIGGKLRLDVYCPSYQLAAEYHGRQHFEYIEFFHGNMNGYFESVKRDERKAELCKELGIGLVVLRYTDDMTEDVVYDRMLYAIRNAPKAELKPKPAKNNAFYERWKANQREYRKKAYQTMKRARGN